MLLFMWVIVSMSAQGNNYKKLSSSTPNCFHRVALVKCVCVYMLLVMEKKMMEDRNVLN